MDGPKNTKTFSVKCEQIPLNPTFCLIYYKGEGQTFDKLIVDLHKLVDNMALTMHNICVILFHLWSIEVLVILWDIWIEDIQNINFWKGPMKYMFWQFDSEKKLKNVS